MKPANQFQSNFTFVFFFLVRAIATFFLIVYVATTLGPLGLSYIESKLPSTNHVQVQSPYHPTVHKQCYKDYTRPLNSYALMGGELGIDSATQAMLDTKPNITCYKTYY